MLSLSLVCSLRVPYNDLTHRTATSPQPTLLPRLVLQGSDDESVFMRKLYQIRRFFGYSTMDFGTDSDVAQPSGRIPALRSTPRAVLYSNCAAKTRNQQSNRRRERKRRTPETVAQVPHTAQSVPWDNGPRISYAGIPIGHRAEPDVRDRKRGVGEGSNPLQVRVGA